MTKINRTLGAIKQSFVEGNIQPDKGKRTTKKTTQYLLTLFCTITDPRVPGMITYPLEYILLIAFLAVLGGANTWQEIHDFGTEKKGWLRKFIDVKKHGIPSHDTFCRVFGILKREQMQNMIVSLIQMNLERIRDSLHIEFKGDGLRHVCIDGKEENGTGRNYKASEGGKVRNIQTLHVYDATDKVCLASKCIGAKTNEIPVAQDILRAMDLENTVCTFDALHMQRETVSIIRSGSGHYVGGLKGNQQGLMEEAASLFPDAVRESLRKSRKRKNPVYYKTVEKAHGQMETREYFLVAPTAGGGRGQRWEDLTSFVLCVKTVEPDDPSKEANTEERYYASDLSDLLVIADAIRSHWAIEQFHWHLDVSFQQDDNSTMDPTAFANLAQLNKVSLHLCQLMQTIEKNTSIKRMRKKFGWNFEENMEKLLSLFDIDAITGVLNMR